MLYDSVMLTATKVAKGNRAPPSIEYPVQGKNVSRSTAGSAKSCTAKP